MIYNVIVEDNMNVRTIQIGTTTMKKALSVVGKVLVILSIPIFIFFIIRWIRDGFDGSFVILTGGLFFLLVGSIFCIESDKMPVKYSRDPLLEKVRYLELRSSNNSNAGGYIDYLCAVTPVFNKANGTYCFLLDPPPAERGHYKHVIGIYDENRDPIHVTNIGFSFDVDIDTGSEFIIAEEYPPYQA